MSEKVTDEMLMAYVDGELDAETSGRLAGLLRADPVLAERAETFRVTARLAKEAFAGVRTAPAPERLVSAVLDDVPPASNVVSFPVRRVMRALPLAASIALAFGLGGYWLGAQGAPEVNGVLGPSQVAEALGTMAAGADRTIRLGSVQHAIRSTGTFRVADGFCRTFEVSGGAETGMQGIACNHGAGWTVDLAVATSGGGEFAPASSGPTGSIDAYLDALAAEGPLSAEEDAMIGR
jgi:hypothetical protein